MKINFRELNLQDIKTKKPEHMFGPSKISGGTDGDRTRDLLRDRQAF